MPFALSEREHSREGRRRLRDLRFGIIPEISRVKNSILKNPYVLFLTISNFTFLFIFIIVHSIVCFFFVKKIQPSKFEDIIGFFRWFIN